LRIAFVMATNGKKPASDGEMQMTKDLMVGLNQMYGKENFFYYVVLPKGLEDVDSFFADLDNVKVLYEDRQRLLFFDEVSVIGSELYYWFNQRIGQYQIDAVITSKTAPALTLQRWLIDFRYAADGDYLKIPVIIWESRVFGRKNTHNLVDSLEFQLRAKSYAALKTIYLSDFEIEEAFDVSYPYLTAVEYKKMSDNAKLLYLGLKKSLIDRIKAETPKKEKFTVFWAGRLSAQKRPEFIFEQFDRLYKSGIDIDITITTPNVDVIKFAKQIEEWKLRNKRLEFLTGVNQEEFLTRLCSSHVVLSASLYEGLSVGFLEMGYSGVPVIVPNRPWSRLIFGDDYPLMYNATDDIAAYTMLEWVYKNYSEAVKIAEKARQRIGEKFDRKNFIAGVYKLLSEIDFSKERLIMGPSMQDALTVTLSKMPAVFTMSEFVTELKAWLRTKINLATHEITLSFPSLWDIRQWLIRQGCVDTNEIAVPTFRKTYKGGTADRR
jgi:glycosyltransferase involved in cell wall biosynthesis